MNQTTAAVEAAVPVESTITGYLKWTSNAAKCGSLAIAIRLLDDSRDELVGISLTKTATADFEKVVSETVFVNDVVTVTVRSENIEADLAAGVGAKGKKYFIGTSVVAA